MCQCWALSVRQVFSVQMANSDGRFQSRSAQIGEPNATCSSCFPICLFWTTIFLWCYSSWGSYALILGPLLRLISERDLIKSIIPIFSENTLIVHVKQFESGFWLVAKQFGPDWPIGCDFFDILNWSLQTFSFCGLHLRHFKHFSSISLSAKHILEHAATMTVAFINCQSFTFSKCHHLKRRTRECCHQTFICFRFFF